MLLIWLAGLAGAAVVPPPPSILETPAETTIRVLLGDTPAQHFRSYGTNPIWVTGGPPWLPERARTIRALALQHGMALELEDADGYLMRAHLDRGVTLKLQSNDPHGIWLGKQRYRGELYLQRSSAGIQVVNRIPIETYLTSVVGGEMPADWPLAALQAQAVAARTYALYHRRRAANYGIEATVSGQIYQGVESEALSTKKAVATTRSLVLVHSGNLIDAVFHSSSGGRTEASVHVWSSEMPYLVSVPDYDQHSPVHKWSVSFSADQLQSLFREIARFESIDVLETSPSGRVHSVRIQGKHSSTILSGQELRQRLGLRSTLVRFELMSDNQLANKQIQSNQMYTVIPSLMSLWHGTTTGIFPGQSKSSLQAQHIWDKFAPLPLPSSSYGLPLQTRSTQAVLLVKGRGYGHGVGMSQWGAHGLAKRGANFRQILRHYYRGIEVVPYQNSLDPIFGLKSVVPQQLVN